MNAVKKVMIASMLALGLCAGTTGAAQAQDNWYAVVNIRNPTNVTLNYQFRWGSESAWQNFSLGPNTTMTHWYAYAYANQNRSPTPQIRFHFNPGEFVPEYKIYNLEAYAAPYALQAYGKPYTFRYLGYGRYLDLFRGY
jgi:hypothetical protein